MSRDGRFGRWHRSLRGGGWILLYGRGGRGRFDTRRDDPGQGGFFGTGTDNLEVQQNRYAITGPEASSGGK